MFYPRCGSQNSDETKYCRGCGADISRVLAVTLRSTTPPLRGTPPNQGGELLSTNPPLTPLLHKEGSQSLAEQQIDLSSRGWRGLLIGMGFLIVADLGFGLSMRTWVLGFFGLIFAIVFLGTGISRFIQAKGLKRLLEPQRDSEAAAALSPGDADYIQPSQSLFSTEDLTATPRSVTEHTTTRLERKDN